MLSCRKLLAASLAGAMLIAAAGCGGAGENPEAPEVALTEENSSLKNGHVFYDPPIQLNIARSVGPDAKFKPGQDVNKNDVTDWMLEEFGVKANYMWTTPTTDNAFYTKIMLSISAGEELPEFFSIPGAQAHELIDSGLMMPIDGLFEKHAGAKWKNAVAEVQDPWLAYTREGQVYAYPNFDYAYEHEDVMWIRDDWLEAAGMEAPKTLEDLRAVMDAFIHLDSSVTGFDKVYGFTAALQSNYTTWLGVNPVFGGFGAIPQIWMKDEAGDIVYGSTMPQIKTALAEFKDWIDKSYFPPEVGLMNEVAAYELFTSGRAGITMGATWCYDWPLQDVEKNVPGAKVGAYPIPNGPTGSFLQSGNGTHYQVVLFSKASKNPQVFFEITDYLYDNYAEPEKGSQFEYGFKDGFDYIVKDDGTVSYIEDDIPGGKASVLFFSAPMIPSQKIAIASYLAEGNEPETPAQIQKSVGWNQIFLDAARIVMSQKEYTVYDLFTGAPTPTMVEKLADLKAFEVSNFSNILYGKTGLDEGFDSWLSYWSSNGGVQITEEVRQWYKDAGGE
ncbi:MAG: extracellular solute-binding protein [Clostridiales bacterium]|jgi:putative aldouronate transport system substrate-binding protein|nr:extracellular solute-binding protein [Clostridiales bacterium]